MITKHIETCVTDIMKSARLKANQEKQNSIKKKAFEFNDDPTEVKIFLVTKNFGTYYNNK